MSFLFIPYCICITLTSFILLFNHDYVIGNSQADFQHRQDKVLGLFISTEICWTIEVWKVKWRTHIALTSSFSTLYLMPFVSCFYFIISTWQKLIRTYHFQRDSRNYQRRIKWNGWTWWQVKSYRHCFLKMKKTFVKNWGKCKMIHNTRRTTGCTWKWTFEMSLLRSNICLRGFSSSTWAKEAWCSNSSKEAQNQKRRAEMSFTIMLSCYLNF